MRISTRVIRNLFCMFLTLSMAVPAQAEPPTSFTYQEHIEESGVPANGPIDLRFTLWDAATDGNQIGQELSIPTTPLEGIFSVSIDFGADAFSGDRQLWMQVEVSPSGIGTFSDLGRQLLEAVPYSLSTRGIRVDEAGNTEVGRLDRPSDVSLSLLTDGLGQYNGSLLFAHGSIDNGFRLRSNELGPDFGFSIADLSADTGAPEVRFFIEDSSGHIGIGTIAPNSPLELRFDSSNSRGLSVRDTDGLFPTIGVESVIESGTALRGIVVSAGLGPHFAVYGENASPQGWAVFANGRMAATGTKSFAIDHPLEPENKILYHYSTETPQPQNRYNGNVMSDSDGSAIVMLPEYFEHINADYRYHLTAIGLPAPGLHVSREIRGNSFVISGAAPNQKISWEVVAMRMDAFVRQHGAPHESIKSGAQRGKYLSPRLYGMPDEAGFAQPTKQSGH